MPKNDEEREVESKRATVDPTPFELAQLAAALFPRDGEYASPPEDGEAWGHYVRSARALWEATAENIANPSISNAMKTPPVEDPKRREMNVLESLLDDTKFLQKVDARGQVSRPEEETVHELFVRLGREATQAI